MSTAVSPPTFPFLSNKPATYAGRTALVVGYDGTRYHGWQAQSSGVRSIQAEVELALSKVANQSVAVVCAGRTDAGVHATNQVVHFDCEALRSPFSWVMGCNHFLASDISIQWAGQVDNDFHARYSAQHRVYRYLIYNHSIRPPWAATGVTWVYQPLDVTLMQRAGEYLIGEHDFSAFRGADCQSSTPFRRITEFSVLRKGPLVVIEVCANAFLHHMVRNIVGSLLLVGMGKQPPQWIDSVLVTGQRALAGATASAAGLYLVKVAYPTEFGLPELAPGPFFLPDG